ncbi:LOW QUALITY PROTEIN: polycystin-1-like protein 2 [Oculina patagonica]
MLNETTLSIEFYKLLPYYAYDVTAIAFNSKGISPPSTFQALTGEEAPVNPPNASAQSLSSTSISVQWSFNSSVRNVLGILRGFKVYYVKQNASEVHTLVTAGADESSLTLVNVEPFTTYKVSVGAFTLAGETIGNPVVVDTLQDVPGAPPHNVFAYNVSSTAIKVHWGSIPVDLQNGIILGYHVIVVLNSNVERNLTASPNMSEMVVTNLQKYTTYQLSISGFTVIGSGVQSTPINVTTDEDVPSLPPNVKAVMLNATSIQVTLLPLPSEFVHGILKEYLVAYGRVDDPLSPATVRSLQVDQLVVNLTNLNEFTNYSIQALATTSKGQGPNSAPIYVKTDEDVPASPPLNVKNISSTVDEIRLRWQPIPPDDVNGILLGYIIQYRLSGAAQWIQKDVSPFVLETTIANLSQYTDYEFQMLGYNSKGHGPVSPLQNIRTEDLDECQTGQDNCHYLAECTNTQGSFTCSCFSGFGGNGVVCSDIDECNPNSCPYGETCINGEGSFFCLNTTNDKDNSSCVFGSNARILNIDKNVNTSTELTKLERYLFMTEVDTICSTLSFEWKVSNVTYLPFSVGKAHSITVGWDSEWSDITSLDLGIYLVEYIVHFQDFYFLDYGFIEVLPSPPVALIAGGPEVSRKHNAIMSLDASPSRDVDLGPGNYDGMTFTWSCKRKDEQFYDELNTFNQNQSSSISAAGGCFGNETQKIDDTSRMLFLDTNTMEVNQYYDIKLTVLTKSGMNNTFVQRVLIVTGEPLYAEINCILNCGSEVIPAVKMILVSNCTNPPCFKESAELRYRWSLFLLNASWSEEVQQLQTMTGTALNTTYLVINPHMLVPDQNYRLTVDLENVNVDNSNGFAVWLFKTSTVPTGGTCTANTSSGVAVKTTFTVDCTNWDDPNTPLLYEFMLPLADGLSTILSYGYTTAAELILPPGDPLKNYTLTIEAVITSSTGSKANTSINVQVLPWPLMSTLNATDEIRRILEGPFATFIGRGDLKRTTQLAIAVLKSLELQESGIVSKEEKTEIKSFIVTTLSKVEVRDLRKLIQISSISSLAMDDPTDVKPDILQMVMEILQDMTNLFANILATGTALDVPYSQIAEKNLVYAIGKQLQASLSGGGGEGEFDHANIDTSLEVLRKILRTVTNGKVVGEEPSVVDTEALDALVVRLHPEEVAGSLLTLETGSVRLPHSANMRELLRGAGDFVDIEVISSPVNYFNWDPSADLITSRVLTIDLKGESGEVLTVRNLTTDIQLGIQVDEQSANNESHTTETLYIKPGRSQYHKLHVIREGTSYLVTIMAKDSLHLFVKYGNKPTVEDHDKNYTIPDFSSCTKNVTVTDEQEEYNCTRNPHQLLLTNEVLKKPGVYYLGILYSRNSSSGNHSHRTRRSCFSTNRQKRSCVETKNPPPPLGVYETDTIPPYDPRTDLNYTIETDELGCRFWSHDKEKWLTEGCKVGPQSTKHRLLCMCNHLTSFGGGLLVAPNPIDMDTVFKELSRLDETGNFGVLLTIIFVFLLYFIAIVFAKRADRKDQAKLGPRIVLETEGDLLSSQYEFTISTGVWADSGTTAKVTMVLYGSSGNSGPIIVFRDLDPTRPLLSRGSVDKYTICLSTTLGTLHHAYVWHDNSGESPSWFLDYVIVREKETRKEWKFICNQWFSAEKDDGKVIRKLSVERTNSLPEFQEAFRSTLSSTLYESHLWMSSVTKRPASSFTRAQRVTCCLCVVFTAMLANAMFFNLGGETTESTLKIGPLKVSMRQIIITIQSCLVIAPINFLIVAIFKNSRPSFDKYCCKRSRVGHEQDLEENEVDDQPLHHIFVYVAWFLCFATAIASATVVFFYSLMWGKETADEWLSSILMSITMDILAIQPVRLVILAAVAAIIITKAKRTKAKLSSKKRSTAWEEEENDDMPEFYSRALPDPMQLEWYKKYKENEAKTMSAFKSLTFFVSFLLILGIVCYGNRDYHQYLMGKEVKAIFPRAAEVKDALGFWTWMMNSFAPAIYATNWYNGDEETNKVYISDKSSVLIGMPRIRQLRIEKDACPKRIVESYNVTEVCYPHYSISCEDKTPMYLPKWKHLPSDASPSSFNTLCPKPWRYKSSDEMNNLPKISPRAIYGGGGYVADLGYDLQTAGRVMTDLTGNNWIDRRTRVAIVEFSIFNSNKNILVVANYFFEFLPTGSVFSHVRVEMLELYGTESSLVQLLLLCRLLLIIMIVVYCVIEIVKMCRQRGLYFKNIWNWLVLVLIVTSVTSVVIHIVREKTTTDTIKEQHKNVYATVSFHKAISLLDIETVFQAVVIFLATVKLLSLLRFSKQIIFLSIAVRFAGSYLASFSVVFIVVFCSFAMSGMVAFGALVESYSSFLRVCVSQFEFLLGKAVPNLQMAKIDPLLAFLFCGLYICSMTILVLNVFIVILNSALEEVKDNLGAVTDELDLADFITLYFTQRISNIFGRKKRKTRRLYCENMTFEDECAYVENCLIEIDRRISILAQDALTEGCVRLKRARLRKTSRIQTQAHLINDKPDPAKKESTRRCNDLPQEDPASDEEESTCCSSESEDVMKDISNPLYSIPLSTTTEKDKTNEMANRPTSPSEINMVTEGENSEL